MKHRPTSRRRRSSTKSVLRLLDLEHSKTAVLNSLTSQDAKRGYRHAIDEFVDWYCSEPRFAFPQRSRSQGRPQGVALAGMPLDGGESGGKFSGWLIVQS